MSTTIEDVAQKARVSTATVSRVMNRSGKVGDKTRQRVEEAMRKLNYVPNLMARGLMLSKTNTIGVLLPTVTGDYFSELIAGIEEQAYPNDYHLLLGSVQKGEAAYVLIHRLIQEGRIDGLLLMAPKIRKKDLQQLAVSKFPVVILDAPSFLKNICKIQTDNYFGAQIMVRHLIDIHKYQRIAFIGGPMDEPDSRERYRGYMFALTQSKIPIRQEYILEGDFTGVSGREKTEQLLKLLGRPEAIFCANDEMARGAMDALLAKGLRIPEEIAVTGFDDLKFASYIRPGLTTVRQPVYNMGKIGMEKLLKMINDKSQTTESVFLKTELVVRESCGCTTHAI